MKKVETEVENNIFEQRLWW